MSAPNLRWHCRRCGIVRDVPASFESLAPWCRHNALDLPAERMTPIGFSHPLADGPLPWGTSDPHRSDAA